MPAIPVKLTLTGTGSIDIAALVTALTPYFMVRSVPIVPPIPVPSSTALSIKRLGPTLVDGNNAPVQLRGVNVAGLESTAVHGWAKNGDGTYNYWGDSGLGAIPDWSKILAWKANVVRLPLNASSWLGLSCVKGDGTAIQADPGTTYQAAVKTAVSGALAAGLRVILDLHWSAPRLVVNGLIGYLLPNGQAPFADADTCLTFWQQIAAQYGNVPGVIFELFNEPFLDLYGGPAGGGDQWATMRDGGISGRFPNQTQAGAYDMYQNWGILGFQVMLTAIRMSGASNLILISGPNYAKKLDQWTAFKVADPLDNIAAVWHLYPAFGTTFGTVPYSIPDWSPNAYPWAEAVVASGYPIMVTETGGHNVAGTASEPFVTNALAWVDKMNTLRSGSVGVLGWGWDVWGNPDNVLIKDALGTPTDGYGKVYHDWMVSK